jgi:hypothetical protein
LRSRGFCFWNTGGEWIFSFSFGVSVTPDFVSSFYAFDMKGIIPAGGAGKADSAVLIQIQRRSLG